MTAIEKTDEKKQTYLQKLRDQISNLKDRNSRLELEARTKIFHMPAELDKKVQCALAYKIPVRDIPLYFNKQEMIQKYVEEGLQKDFQDHADLFNRLGYEVATDMTLLNKKVA